MKKVKARRLPRGAAYFFRWKRRKLLYIVLRVFGVKELRVRKAAEGKI